MTLERNKRIFENRTKPRPTGQPVEDAWTIEEIQERMEQSGRRFSPSPDIANRLAQDLANGALVFFTQREVLQASEEMIIKSGVRRALEAKIIEANDVVVVPYT